LDYRFAARHRVQQHRLGHAANREIANQISAHSPSDNSTTEISGSPRLSRRVGSHPVPERGNFGSCRIRLEAAEQTRGLPVHLLVQFFERPLTLLLHATFWHRSPQARFLECSRLLKARPTQWAIKFGGRQLPSTGKAKPAAFIEQTHPGWFRCMRERGQRPLPPLTLCQTNKLSPLVYGMTGAKNVGIGIELLPGRTVYDVTPLAGPATGPSAAWKRPSSV
jgi:hypothetical protein